MNQYAYKHRFRYLDKLFLTIAILYQRVSTRTHAIGLIFFSLCSISFLGSLTAHAETAVDNTSTADETVTSVGTEQYASRIENYSGNILQDLTLQQLHAELENLNRSGNHQATIELLHEILERQQQVANRSLVKETLLYSGLAMSYLAQGRTESAEHYIEIALAGAEKSGDNRLWASLLNDQGKIYAIVGNTASAVNAFEASAAMARSEKLAELYAISSVNLARELYKDDQSRNGLSQRRFSSYVGKAEGALAQLEEGKLKAELSMTLGKLYARAAAARKLSVVWRLDALKAYNYALAYAKQYDNPRIKSYAYGYMAELYEVEQRFAEALGYAEKALFAAQSANIVESRYQWEWLVARLHVGLGQYEAALDSYRQAIDSLKHIRRDLVRSTDKGYAELVGNVYLGFADLVLRNTSKLEEGAEKQTALAEVINTIESMRVAEMEDYLHNQCHDFQSSHQQLAETASSHVIAYPLLLADRVEIIAVLNGTYYQTTTPVNKAEVVKTINALRDGIETYSSDHRYLQPSQQLYQWLIKPMEPLLNPQTVDTLVVVPDGALRTIPLSSLNDGQQFLVERLALATTPGLKMTMAAAASRADLRVMANGLTEAVQGFSSLPGVDQELVNISSQFNTTVYKDNAFQLATVAGEISSNKYSVVHFATHGEFSSDHSKSFLLTHDAKLTLDRIDQTLGLRRLQDEPLDLLVLSACQTASGDDRAALGLAGVAVQAGARSAVATLWYINDEATSGLVSDFYLQLQDQQLSKAQALQRAQINMIRQERFKHPNYWAPFLMIGNWM